MPARTSKNARGKGNAAAKPAVAAKSAASPTASLSANDDKMGAAQSADPQHISQDDAGLLADVFQQYEEKKYAASVQSAETILRKYPSNAQATCMKGLGIYNLGKRDEGKQLARRGLALDTKSHVCWHVVAIIHRADREYKDAMKCYLQANRIEPNDLNVLRDLIALQLFLRHYDGAATSRLALLRLQPRIRHNWTAVAVAYHFAGDYARATEILQSYCDMMEQTPANDYEYSEVILYTAQVLAEGGHPDQALSLLDKESKRIMDVQTRKEMAAQMHKRIGKLKAAELRYTELLEDNPDNKTYVLQYLSCRGIELEGISDAQRQLALDALSDLSDRLPRSRTVRRTVLDVATGSLFRRRASAYLIDGLSRGIPSLFSDIKMLLADTEKKSQLLDILVGFRKCLDNGNTLDGDCLDDEEEAPTTYVWLLYLMAQVHLHLRDYVEAATVISAAIEHTPSLPELYTSKARIEKRSGDYLAAEESLAQARALDGQDRYLNAKHVKYLLKADDVQQAESVASLFTRKDAESALADLTDMQCLWFLLAEAESYYRQGKLGLALKRCHNVEKIFSEVYEDEFEFQAYCMRKFTLRACIDMARSNEKLRRHPAFLKASRIAADIYLHLDKHPVTKPIANGHHENGLPETIHEAQKGSQPSQQGNGDEASDIAHDDDPLGDNLVRCSMPLNNVETFVAHLEVNGEASPSAQHIIFDVALRKGQILRALKALETLKALAPESPELHWRIFALHHQLQVTQADAGDSSVWQAARSQADALLQLETISPEMVSDAYLQRHPHNADAVLAAARGQWYLSSQKGDSAIIDILHQAARPENNVSLATAEAALRFLSQDVQVESGQVDNLRKAFLAIYPNATVLRSKEDVEAQKQQIDDRRRQARESGNEDI